MNYNTMEAGPEMDRLIAEKVMGWSIYHYDKGERGSEYWSLLDANCNAVDSGSPTFQTEFGSEADAFAMFQPSLYLIDAWQVVEHMTQTTKEEWEFRVTTTLHVAIFEFEGGRDRPWRPGQYVGEALSLPLAICRAALVAVAK